MSVEVFNKFSDMVDRHQCVSTGESVNCEDGASVPTVDAVADEFDRRASELGLERSRAKAARYVVFEGRSGDLREVTRDTAYALPLANMEDPMACARALAEHIHGRWGAGRVWTIGRPGYLRHRAQENSAMPLFGPGHEEDTNTDAGFRTFVDPTSTERRLRMGVYYAHENMPSREPTS